MKIDTLTIEKFRALRKLKLEGLGRVNLITGRNNAGKSSVLEALRLVASKASTSVISSILRYREEDLDDSDETARASEGGLSMIASLFLGCPSSGKIDEKILISATGNEFSQQIVLSVGRFIQARDPDGTIRLVSQPGLFDDSDSAPALVVEINNSLPRNITLDRFRRKGRIRVYRPEWVEEPGMPCVFISPYGSEHSSTLGALWDKIALSDREQDVVEALRIISPDIVAVSMIGGEGAVSRIAIARSRLFPRPVPLRSFGDGLNRIFGIVLSLVSAKGGILLIDEIENGLHHSIQLDLWRVIFRLARQLDIQIFATSHSWDSVESFQKASAEDEDAGVLLRLLRNGDDIVSTFFSETELAIATREHIEVR